MTMESPTAGKDRASSPEREEPHEDKDVVPPSSPPPPPPRPQDNSEGKEDPDEVCDRLIAKATLLCGVALLIAGAIVLLVSKITSSSSGGDDGSATSDPQLLAGIISLGGGVAMAAWGWMMTTTSHNSSPRATDTKPAGTKTTTEDAQEDAALEAREEVSLPGEAQGSKDKKGNKVALEEDVFGQHLPYDKLLVGGTLSLGLVLLIGAMIILSISLVKRTNLDGADVDDFVSLGPQACRIQGSVVYETVTEEQNALNTICKEEYQYEVVIVDASAPPTTFVSQRFSKTRCQTSCESCNPNLLYGPDFYLGVDPTRLGEPITNSTYVECWRPDMPVAQLSDYYDCGKPGGGTVKPSSAAANNSCYQIADPSEALKKEQNSNRASMVAAIIGLAGAVTMTAIGVFFVCRNQAARRTLLLQGDDSHHQNGDGAIVMFGQKGEVADENDRSQVDDASENQPSVEKA